MSLIFFLLGCGQPESLESEPQEAVPQGGQKSHPPQQHRPPGQRGQHAGGKGPPGPPPGGPGVVQGISKKNLFD